MVVFAVDGFPVWFGDDVDFGLLADEEEEDGIELDFGVSEWWW